MSRTGPLCPATKGTSGGSRPTYNTKYVLITYHLCIRDGKKYYNTFESGRTRKAPPPPDSTMTAKNFGLTEQNVESHDDLETRMLSKHCSLFRLEPKMWRNLDWRTTRNDIFADGWHFPSPFLSSRMIYTQNEINMNMEMNFKKKKSKIVAASQTRTHAQK